ncbi:hypothetical protein ACNQGB_05395 [Flavobacterium sp. XS1P32]|uniref:hypothetical protein n=1 Tax=Flavobacterium sp. XS1P32 TaxID=3401726 RepID=UPI003AB038D5
MKKSEVKTKKMSLANIKGGLTLVEMENVMAGKNSGSCGSATGFLCTATALLLFTGPFASLSAATGIGCAIGIYAGCSE